VVKILAARQPLLGTLAKGHAGNGLQVTGTAFIDVIALVLRRLLADLLQPLVVAGVGRQPTARRRGGAALGAGLVDGKTFLAFQ